MKKEDLEHATALAEQIEGIKAVIAYISDQSPAAMVTLPRVGKRLPQIRPEAARKVKQALLDDLHSQARDLQAEFDRL